ncbi:hypothetical protein BGZ95_001232 [Linnemannia exigua]|uniref:C2H2-type domain-containing protein n=1 Tax=Linnemannia exigua TaxID=604196 RepID=A0AAD4D9A6_9FUNG|nr:hypothetical protein BGZ95_001232 [Linnemannia exigua]
MDFSAFLVNSVVILATNDNSGANSDCFDTSKSSINSNNNNSKNENSATTASTFPAVFFPEDMNNNNNNSFESLYAADYLDQFTADPEILAGLENTPDLSPAMSGYSPAVDSIGSPYNTYDPLGFGESSTPSIDYRSPIEDPLEAYSFESDFGIGNSHESLGYSPDAIWGSQPDFELFPVCDDESAKLKKLLMDPQSEILSTIKESPFEPTLDNFSPVISDTVSPAMTTFNSQEIICPSTFSEAKLLGQDLQAPNYRVAPRKVTQSPTKVGFQPVKKQRRRRITSEEASRVIPTEQMSDPNAKPRYKCSECGKTFSHRDTHSGFRPFECPHKDKNGNKCKWSFARRHDLERHIISKHTKGKNFQCRTCGVECTRSDAFKRHLARNEQCNAGASAADIADADMDLDSDQVSHL